jgi:hypothetical protein
VISTLSTTPSRKPLALLVLLESIGHIVGIKLPQWAMNTIDFVTEEHAKFLLKRLGVGRYYDRVVILEDEQVNGPTVVDALLTLSRTHAVDQLLLVHGLERALVGHLGKVYVDAVVFDPLLAAYRQNPELLDLRMVYGLNCYGVSLAPLWMQLGAVAVNGAVGVNWLPEPSLSLFLKRWFSGATYAEALIYSHSVAIKAGKQIWPDQADGSDHPHVAGSRQVIYGQRDLTLR